MATKRLLYPLVVSSLIAALLAISGLQSRADDVLLGSVRLRGGIDANPTLLPSGRPSVFGGVEGAVVAGRDSPGSKIGVSGEFARTEYATRGLLPAERYRLAIDGENTANADWELRSTSSVESTRTFNLRAFDAAQRVRVQYTGSALRPFVSAEVRYSTLNETNAFFSDFLPEDQRFGRATVIPGVVFKTGDGELGASVNLSATRYADEPDLFGYRRNNERVEPFLFFRRERNGVTVSGSISKLYGTWHDIDFSKVNAWLYDASVVAKHKPWTLELAAKRVAGETTFPISPLTLTSSMLAKLTWAPSDQWTVGVVARLLRTEYVDAPFNTRVFAYGGTASYAFGDDWTVSAELLGIKAVALNGVPVDGGIATVSLAKKFSFGNAKK